MSYQNIEDRLINFAILAVQITETMPATRAATHLANQLLRSGTSPALNYGEARGGESKRDFLHKIRVVLKELRESFNCLKIIFGAKIYTDEIQMQMALKENNELISIFVASARTAENGSS